MDRQPIREQLAEFAAGIPLTDCCEHHRPADGSPIGLAAWLGSTQLAAAWMQPAAPDARSVARWLAGAATTRAYRWLLEALRRTLAFETELNESSFEPVDQKLAALTADPAAVARLAMETVRVERVLLDAHWNPFDPNIRWDICGYRPLLNVDAFLWPRDPACAGFVATWKRRLNLRAGELDEYLHLVASAILAAQELGTLGLTCRLGRSGPLPTAVADRGEVAAVFAAEELPRPPADRRMADCIFWHVLQQAEIVGVPVLLEVGELPASGAHVLQLMPTLQRFAGVRFALLGGGYPWCRETVALGRQFANLHVDIGRVAMFSPRAAAELLGEWLDVVPGGPRRVLFSGTAASALETYAVRLAAEDLLAGVLADRVATGTLGTSAAIDAVQSALHDAGQRFFGLTAAQRLPTLR